ncbi:hypothetical protein L0F63_002706, partial [Massospora cicadina]
GVEGKSVRAYSYQPEGCGFDSRPSHINRGASQRKLLAGDLVVLGALENLQDLQAQGDH